MTIQELEARTELERATIRYYEREGLITPSRRDNSYRDYSEEDAGELLKIKLLRKLNLSIDTIRQLQQGSADITDVLVRQAAALEAQITELDRAKAICKEISAAQTTYQSLDAAHYLGLFDREPQQEGGTGPAAAANSPYREYHPWRRFIARVLDYALLRTLIKFILIVVLRIRPYGDLLSTVVVYGSLLLAIPVYGFMLHRFATTPGKWLMGIRVLSFTGDKLTVREALTREWHALFYGYGLGIPIVRLWRLYSTYKAYRDLRPVKEDEAVEHIYTKWVIFWNTARKLLFAAACILVVVTTLACGVDSIKPKYRGNSLTVAEFAENYNFYDVILNEDSTVTMNPDGTWLIPQYSENIDGVVINMGGNATNKNSAFEYETEGERLTAITYNNTWTDFTIISFPEQLIAASVATVMSQRNVGIADLISFLTELYEALRSETGNVSCGNVTVQWAITSRNCVGSPQRYVSIDPDKTASVTLWFQISFQ